MLFVLFFIFVVIDVDVEVGYWCQCYVDGMLGFGFFGYYVLWIKFVCDLLIIQFWVSDEQCDEFFQIYYVLQIMLCFSEDQVCDFVEQCWEYVYCVGCQDLVL